MEESKGDTELFKIVMCLVCALSDLCGNKENVKEQCARFVFDENRKKIAIDFLRGKTLTFEQFEEQMKQ